MNSILQTISGITIAALGEALALAERAGLQMKDVMEIIGLTNMASTLIREKGDSKFFLNIYRSNLFRLKTILILLILIKLILLY